ncbi:peptide chain release factor N(5)-glutamine methyltransferase [Candidatus Daviesbacteria bacterium]|nr:peptide chain release factor N(5)-glutamine methyltransferase [Candidatus Daviesbacteria bacterium]
MKNSTRDVPTAYKNGYVEFYKLRFKVTPDVLIPRPETELLVDEVIRFLADHPERSGESRRVEGSQIILDVGTGAGNIAISLAKNLSHLGGVTIVATDISQKALKVAQQNAKLHGVEDKITFIQSDLLNVIPTQIASSSSSPRYDTKVDIIVTNLPYIPTERIDYLDTSVKDFEPKVALDGGEDGFELYRNLFAQIKQKGWHPKLIVCEIDYTHAEIAIREAQKLVVSEVEPFFPEAEVEVKLDLAKKQRILLIRQFL